MKLLKKRASVACHKLYALLTLFEKTDFTDTELLEGVTRCQHHLQVINDLQADAKAAAGSDRADFLTACQGAANFLTFLHYAGIEFARGQDGSWQCKHELPAEVREGLMNSGDFTSEVMDRVEALGKSRGRGQTENLN